MKVKPAGAQALCALTGRHPYLGLVPFHCRHLSICKDHRARSSLPQIYSRTYDYDHSCRPSANHHRVLNTTSPELTIVSAISIMATTARNQRACMLCSIVLPYSSFSRSGCPNCEEFLQLQNSPDNIGELTSQVFEGLIALHDPKNSWVAKWQRLTEYVPGLYATKVQGKLPPDVVGTLEDAGVRYVPRDGSGGDAELVA